MFVDTSACVAILADEPGASALARRLEVAPIRLTSWLVRLETVMRLSLKLDVSCETANGFFDRFLTEASIEVVPITDEISRAAVAAFAKYGKGRGHPARLNLADCMSYACAKTLGAELLFVGEDFAQTDLGEPGVPRRPRR